VNLVWVWDGRLEHLHRRTISGTEKTSLPGRLMYTRGMVVPMRLRPEDARRYARLRMRMLLDAPWAFSANPEDDKGLDIAHLGRSLADDAQAVFAVEEPADAKPDRELIAAAGIVRPASPKFRHRASIWGVFVEPAYRGQGLGRAVMTAAVELAKAWPGIGYVDLGVSERGEAARRLYESLGFRAWGREPEATEIEGRRYDEIHMTLRLCTRAPSAGR
jgi:RimJ/RimL family protein N-acetyltransferase